MQKDKLLSGIVRTWRRVLGPETRGGAVLLAGESLSISGLCGLGLCSRSLLVWLVWSVCYWWKSTGVGGGGPEASGLGTLR